MYYQNQYLYSTNYYNQSITFSQTQQHHHVQDSLQRVPSYAYEPPPIMPYQNPRSDWIPDLHQNFREYNPPILPILPDYMHNTRPSNQHQDYQTPSTTYYANRGNIHTSIQPYGNRNSLISNRNQSSTDLNFQSSAHERNLNGQLSRNDMNQDLQAFLDDSKQNIQPSMTCINPNQPSAYSIRQNVQACTTGNNQNQTPLHNSRLNMQASKAGINQNLVSLNDSRRNVETSIKASLNETTVNVQAPMVEVNQDLQTHSNDSRKKGGATLTGINPNQAPLYNIQKVQTSKAGINQNPVSLNKRRQKMQTNTTETSENRQEHILNTKPDEKGNIFDKKQNIPGAIWDSILDSLPEIKPNIPGSNFDLIPDVKPNFPEPTFDSIPDIKPNILELTFDSILDVKFNIPEPTSDSIPKYEPNNPDACWDSVSDIKPSIEELNFFIKQEYPDELEGTIELNLDPFLNSSGKNGTKINSNFDLFPNFKDNNPFDWEVIDLEPPDEMSLLPSLEWDALEIIEEKPHIILSESPPEVVLEPVVCPSSILLPPEEPPKELEIVFEVTEGGRSRGGKPRSFAKQRFRPFVCSQCTYATSRFEKLEKHVKKQHPDDFEYDESPEPIRRRPKRKSKKRNKYLKCSQCSYHTPRNDRLKKHMEKIHSKNVCYACNICRFESTYNRDYYDHMRKHFRGPPFVCEECGYASKLITAFIAHVVSHTGDRLFRCTLCSFSCKRKYHLKGHMVSHTKDKNFVCQECSKRYSYKCSLVRHIKTSCSDTLRSGIEI